MQSYDYLNNLSGFDDFSMTYNIIHFIGKGAFGKTYYGWNKINNMEVAIKFINIDFFKTRSKNAIPQLVSELKNLQQLSFRPNCSKFVVCYIEAFHFLVDQNDTLVLITEYINGQNLAEYISAQLSPILPEKLYEIYLEISKGLKYIHESGFAHRDIKPDNIMITVQGQLKFIDFGMSCFMDNCRNYAGSKYFNPPEFNRRLMIDDPQKNIFPTGLLAAQAHDIFSLGIVFYMLATGVAPYENWTDIMNKKLPIFPYGDGFLQFTNGDFNFLFDRMLHMDPNIRYNIFQVINLLENPQKCVTISNQNQVQTSKQLINFELGEYL